MDSMRIFSDYVGWHYGRAFREVFVVWLNFAWFITHMFSIPLLAHTLFSPWKRVHEAYQRNGFEELAATLVLNILSRILGALIRTVIIIVGSATLILWVLCLCVVCVFWIFAPVLIVASFATGFMMLF